MNRPTLGITPNATNLTDIALTSQALKASGGLERYTRDVIAGLHRLGIKPTLYAREIDDSMEEAQWINAHPLNVRWVPRKLRNLWFNHLLKRQLTRHRPQCVLAINNSPYADITICGGTHPGSLEAAGARIRASDRWQFDLEHRTYHHARRIVAHARLMAHELQRYYAIPADKIDVIYPPVETSRFRLLDGDARRAVRHRFGIPADKTLFVFSSTNHKRKGYDLIEPFFLHTDLPVCLVVAGRPVPRTSETLRYAGYCHDIENLFAAADYTIVASVYEPFGLVAVESVICGTPVVIADNVGAAEAIRPDAKLEFSRASPDGFSAAIHAALARAQAGTAQIVDPRSQLVYDPDVDMHVAALYQLMQTV